MGGSNTIEVAIQSSGVSDFQKSIMGAETALINLRSAALGAGLGLVALGTMGAMGISKAINASRDVNSAFREVTTLMGEGEDAADQFGDTVGDLTVEFGAQGGEVEVINALYQTLSAGFTDAAEAELLLAQAMQLGTAGLTDTETAVDSLTTILNAYGLDASEAERASDVLFETVRQGKTTMQELAPAMGTVIPIAAELGVPIEEVGAALATLTAQGQSTDEAVTATRAAMTQLLSPTDAAKGLIQELGYESGRALVEAQGFGGAIQTLAKQAGESNVPMAEVFSNVRAMQAAFPIAGDAADKFNENLGKMENSAGATDKAFSIMSDSLGFRLTQATNQANVLLADFGEILLAELMPAIEKILGVVERAFAAFKRLDGATQGLAARALILGTALSLLVGTALLVAVGIAAIAGPAMAAGGALLTVAGILTGPVGLAILGIIALAALLYTAWTSNFMGIQEKTASAIAAVRGAIQGAIAFILPFVNEALARLQAIWDLHFSGIVEEVALTLQHLQNVFRDALNFILDTVIRPALAAISALWGTWGTDIMAVVTFALNTVTTIIENALDLLLTAFRVGMALLRGDWEGAWTLITEFLGRWKERAVGILSEALTVIQGVVKTGTEQAVAAAQLAWDAFITWLTDLGTRIVETISGWVTGIVETITGMATNLYNAFLDWWPGIVPGLLWLNDQIEQAIFDWGPKLVAAIVQLGTDIAASIVEWVTGVVTAITGLGDTAKTTTEAWGPKILPAIVTIGTDLVDAIIEWGSSIGPAIVTLGEDLVAFIVEWGPKADQVVIDIGASIVETIVGWGGDLLTAADTALQNVIDAFTDFGNWLIWGSYVDDTFQKVIDVVSGLMEAWVWLLETAFGTMQTAVATALDIIKDAVVDGFTAAKDGAIGAVDSLSSAVGGVFTTLKGAITTAVNGARDAITGAFQSAKSTATSAMSTMASAIRSTISGLASKISGLLSSLAGARRRVSGAVSGMRDRVAGATRDARTAASGAVDTAVRIVRSGADRLGAFLGFQHGGIVTGPTPAVIGEGREDEAVLPLSHLEGMMTDVVRASQAREGRGRGAPFIENLTIEASGREEGREAGRAFLRELRSAGFRP